MAIIKDENPEKLKPDQLKIDAKREKVKDHSSDKFFIGIIVVGVLVLALLIINRTFDKDHKVVATESSTTENTTSKKATFNIGERSTYDYPLSVGGTTLATLYDSEADVYTDVDVTAVRFIEAPEAMTIAQNQGATLHDGFEWQGFVYEIKLNDLEYLKDHAVSPILNAKLYKWGGNDYFIYEGHHYFIDVKTVYNSIKIKNKETAAITVYYEVPIGETEYSICLGNELHTLGCFSKFVT